MIRKEGLEKLIFVGRTEYKQWENHINSLMNLSKRTYKTKQNNRVEKEKNFV